MTAWKEIEILFQVLIEKTRDGPPADIPDDRCFLAVMGEGEMVHLTGGGNMEVMAKAMASLLYRNNDFIVPFEWALRAAVGRLEEEGKIGEQISECRICHRTGVEIDPDVDMCRSCWLDVRKGE